MRPPPTWFSLVVIVVSALNTSCSFAKVSKRSLTSAPADLGPLGHEQKVKLAIKCTNSDVASGLRNTSQVLFYLHYCHVNVATGCQDREEKLVALLGMELNRTVQGRDEQVWMDRQGFPHYMLVHVTLPMTDVGRCFTCRKLYNFAFPEEEEWHNTSALCLTPDPGALQLSGQVSSRALSITVSSSSPVSFTQRTHAHECTQEKQAAVNTKLLITIIVLLVVGTVVAGAAVYCVHLRRRATPSSVSSMPDSHQPLSDKANEEKDNEENVCIDLHRLDGESPLGSCLSYRQHWQPAPTLPEQPETPPVTARADDDARI